MSFYKLFGGISGSSDPATNLSTSTSSVSGAETIERLCDRVQSASLHEDRRDALVEIKSLSKKFKLEVGTHAMPVLVDVLDRFRNDSEICCLALDSLFNIMTTDKTDETEQANLPADITTQFTEMLIKKNTNINLIFDLLDEFEFQTRWTSLKLLNALVINQAQGMQELALEIPRGVSRLMDLLSDSREIIRNDTILLLNNLTRTNANIQKIIAFESGFDRIMEIIEGEGSVLDGGIIVEDCFNLLLNLLQSNSSNQSFFKEANYIKMLCKYLDLSSATPSSTQSFTLNADLGESTNALNVWTAQKTKNLSLLLKLIRCLVAPTNQHAIVAACQKAYSHFGLLHRLSALLTLPGIPPDLLSETISTVGEVIRGNAANQTLFANVQMQTDPPRPIIVILLMSLINEKQPFYLRCSILYCFQCFMYENQQAKSDTIETLLPKQQQQQQQQQTASSAIQITTGQILCGGLFAPNELYSNWFCAVAIAHTINNSTELKEQLLRVQLALDGNAVSLMQQCVSILVESTSLTTTPSRYKFQTTVAILMLMSTWLVNCPLAVGVFLADEQNVSYLISQVSSTDTEDKSLIIQGLTAFLLGLCLLYNSNQVQAYSVEKLRDIIKKRVGIEQFEGKLEFISQHESYTKTLKRPTMAFKCKKANDMLFDYEFTRLFKSNETLIAGVLKNNSSVVVPQITEETLTVQLQQIIRDQDVKIRAQQQENENLRQVYMHLQESYRTFELTNGEKVSRLENRVKFLEDRSGVQEDELSKLRREKGMLNEALEGNETVSGLKSKISDLNQEQESLLTLLQEMELKLKHYKRVLRACGQDREVSESEEEDECLNEDVARTSSGGKFFKEDGAARISGAETDFTSNPEQSLSVADSIKLNNTADFDNLNSAEPDEYDAYHATNYMHEILEKNNFSDNASRTDSNSGNNSDHDHSTSQSSSNSDSQHRHNHHSHNHKDLNYPPPAGHNLPIQNKQKPVQIFNPNLFTDSKNAMNEQKILNNTTANVPLDEMSTTSSAEASVNPFFMQHPFFNKQFQQKNDSPIPKAKNTSDFI